MQPGFHAEGKEKENKMVETVASVEMAVDETLSIVKNHIRPVKNTSGKRICIVTGTHGDELEGQYVCFEVNRRLREHPEYLTGVVDIYPALNPLGIDSMTRGIPGFDLDMNRIFPGSKEGTMAEYVAACVVEDIKGADLCIDIHASNIFLKEIIQVRINEETQDLLVPMAEKLNVDFIWVHQSATVLESTLAYSLNKIGTPTLVVEMGVGMRLTSEYCYQMVNGIFYEMKELGMWKGPVAEVKKPLISKQFDEVSFLNAGYAGIFVQTALHNTYVKQGEEIGYIMNPLTGEIKERALAEREGLLFTLREYPVVDEGSLLARILTLDGLKGDEISLAQRETVEEKQVRG